MWKSIRVPFLLLGVSTSLINFGFNDTEEHTELIKNSAEKQVIKKKNWFGIRITLEWFSLLLDISKWALEIIYQTKSQYTKLK